jgi:hypothetical protein
MRLVAYCLAASVLAAVWNGANAQEEEEGPDIRGEWVADINPTSRDMFVTDCACESYTEQIEMICSAKSGVVEVNLNDFITEQAKAGDAATIVFDIDGIRLERTAKMTAFSGAEVRPTFDASLDDRLFEMIAAGRNLSLSAGDRMAVSPLKGSKSAIGKMLAYCAK